MFLENPVAQRHNLPYEYVSFDVPELHKEIYEDLLKLRMNVLFRRVYVFNGSRIIVPINVSYQVSNIPYTNPGIVHGKCIFSHWEALAVERMSNEVHTDGGTGDTPLNAIRNCILKLQLKKLENLE